MMDLTPHERRELKDLTEQLIEATNNNTYWLNQVRETSIELRDRLNAWLDDDQEPDT
ncbi:hypothetical protein [Allosalinactinospora lopnorensis]|uniref:hypothetical protein n=1 Tax=Allosalinactinospora lopnorensis TaxID=1352348 RepID=UPI0012E2F6EB|nr:hypothetical protein [Allosalinactinospora lopnorensis]